MAKHITKYLFISLIISEFLIDHTFGQLDNETSHQQHLQQNYQNNINQNDNTKEFQVNYQQLKDKPHHIVKRKSKGGFGFGKKGKSSKPKSKPVQNSNPYPKQPAYNPNYNPHGQMGPPPPYPGMSNNRPSYPAGAPPPYPGTGLGHNNYPSYHQPNYNYPGCKN